MVLDGLYGCIGRFRENLLSRAPSYPLVSELPPIIETRKWDWKPRGDFFLGTDESGVVWLTKMRGAFRGYREVVFERLVQRTG